jgi:hypothetical protein
MREINVRCLENRGPENAGTVASDLRSGNKKRRNVRNKAWMLVTNM